MELQDKYIGFFMYLMRYCVPNQSVLINHYRRYMLITNHESRLYRNINTARTNLIVDLNKLILSLNQPASANIKRALSEWREVLQSDPSDTINLRIHQNLVMQQLTGAFPPEVCASISDLQHSAKHDQAVARQRYVNILSVLEHSLFTACLAAGCIVLFFMADFLTFGLATLGVCCLYSMTKSMLKQQEDYIETTTDIIPANSSLVNEPEGNLSQEYIYR